MCVYMQYCGRLTRATSLSPGTVHGTEHAILSNMCVDVCQLCNFLFVGLSSLACVRVTSFPHCSLSTSTAGAVSESIIKTSTGTQYCVYIVSSSFITVW